MSARDVIEAANAKFEQAMLRGDAETMASFFAEDAMMILPEQKVVRGREAICEYYKDLAGGGAKMTISIVDLEEHGSVVSVVGRYETENESGYYMEVDEVREDGTVLAHKQVVTN